MKRVISLILGIVLTLSLASAAYSPIQNDIKSVAGNIGIGTTVPGNYKINALADSSFDSDAYLFTGHAATTGERDVFTINDTDVGGGSQDESSSLKIVRSGLFNSADDGASILELTYTGGSPQLNKHFYTLGRLSDEGAVEWGVDLNNANFWTTGDIYAGATGTDCGGTGAACFNSPAIGMPVNGSDIYFNTGGNFGIGISSPSEKLEVIGNIKSSGEIISTSANSFRDVTGNYGVLLRNDGANFYLLATASGDQYGSWNGLRPLIINVSTGDVKLAGSAFFAKHNGNVGIGTSSPDYKLDVRGGNTVVDDYFYIRDYDDGTITNPTRMISRDGNFVIWDGGLVIGGTPANGALGDIGTGNMLVQSRISFDNGLSDGAGLEFRSQGFTSYEIDNSGGSLRFFQPGQTKMTLDSNGKLGVGTESPDRTLEVIGDAVIGTEGTGLAISSDGYLSDEDDAVTVSDELIVTGSTHFNAGDSIYFENDKHAITYNDGQGNFNIRIGHVSNSSTVEEVTEIGYPMHMEFNQAGGQWQMNIDGTSRSAGDVASWTHTLQFDQDGVLKVDGAAIDPVGEITMYGKSTAPTGWLLCNGAAVSRTTYSDLFAVIGTSYGSGDGSTTFNLPNLVNKFARGGTPGSTGGDDDAIVVSHGHTFTGNALGTHSHTRGTMEITGSFDMFHHHGGYSIIAYESGAFTQVANARSWTDSVSLNSENEYMSRTSFTASRSWTGSTQAVSAGTPSGTVVSAGVSGVDKNIPEYVGVSFIIKY